MYICMYVCMFVCTDLYRLIIEPKFTLWLYIYYNNVLINV